MRRLPVVLLALTLLGAGVSLALTGAPFVRPSLMTLPGLRQLARLHLLNPECARAAEKLRFRRVPAESADASHRAGDATTAPTPPPPESPPSTPESPHIVKSGDVMRVGSDIHVGRDEVVRGSVSAIGGDVTVDGHVEGDVSAIRGDVYLSASARVDGDVVSAGGQIHEEPGAFVGGQRVTALPGRHARLHRAVEHEVEGLTGAMCALVWLLVLLGVSWAIVQLSPGRTTAAVDTLKRTPLLSFGIGALILALIIPSTIALALVVAFLCITIIGIPLALAAMLGYGLFFVVFGVWGFVVGASALGDTVLRRRNAMAGSPSVAVTLPRAAIAGVLIMAGAQVLGSFMGASITPFRVLGGFLFVISIIVMSLTTVTGGGAWVRSEFATGTLGRWWQRRKQAPAPPVSPEPPAAGGPGPAPAPAPPVGSGPPAA